MISNIKNVIVVLVTIVFFVSCKKGEDDPQISFRSRKARLVGTWQIQTGSVTSQTATATYTSSFSGKYDNTSYTSNSVSVFKNPNQLPSSRDEQGLFTHSISFNKSGDFIYEKHSEGVVFINGINTGGAQNISTTIIQGTWNFTGNIGNRKKKDHVVITATSISLNGVTTIISGNRSNYTYYLKELTNQKLVLRREISEITDIQTYTFDETFVFDKM